MKNIVILLAGGVGSRFGANIPKQFVKVEDKPIIIHTLEKFEENNLIDEVVVVCLEDWIDYVRELVENYGIKKVVGVIKGGSSAQYSLMEGIQFINDRYHGENPVVMIHESVRPLINDEIIEDAIKVASENQVALSGYLSIRQSVWRTKDCKSSNDYNLGYHCYLTTNPQTAQLSYINELIEVAKKNNFDFQSHSGIEPWMAAYGYRAYFSYGIEDNIKITTSDDLDRFIFLLNQSRKSRN